MSRRDLALALAAATAQGVAFAVAARLLQRRGAPAGAAPTADPALQDRLARVEQRLDALERREKPAAGPAPAPREATSAPSQTRAVGVPAPHPPDLGRAAFGGIEPPFPRPRSAESYLEEGTVYFAVGQFERAAERFGRALEADPTLGSAYYNRGLALARLGRGDEALADYDRAAELLPGDADVFNNRGLLHCANGDFAAALVDFRRAAELAPDDALIRLNLGLTLLETSEPAEALAEFERAFGGEAAFASARYGAALALTALGRSDEAGGALAEAVAADAELAAAARAEPRLVPLHADPRVRALLDAASVAPARTLD